MTIREGIIALICLITGGTIGAVIICCCVAAGREDRRMEQTKPRTGSTMACKNCNHYRPSRTRRWRGRCDVFGDTVKAYSYHKCGKRRRVER